MMEEPQLRMVPDTPPPAMALAKDVEAQFVEIMVPLYSYGCGKKIKKVLARFKGIYSINVDYNKQKVTLWGICNKEEVLSTIRGKRKGARFWNQQQDNDGLVVPSPPTRSPLSLTKGPLNWKATWKKLQFLLRSN